MASGLVLDHHLNHGKTVIEDMVHRTEGHQASIGVPEVATTDGRTHMITGHLHHLQANEDQIGATAQMRGIITSQHHHRMVDTHYRLFPDTDLMAIDVGHK